MSKRSNTVSAIQDPRMQDPTPYPQSFGAKPNIEGIQHKILQSYVLDDAERKLYKRHIKQDRSLRAARGRL